MYVCVCVYTHTHLRARARSQLQCLVLKCYDAHALQHLDDKRGWPPADARRPSIACCSSLCCGSTPFTNLLLGAPALRGRPRVLFTSHK